MALATQCPHCKTIFRVAQDQLKLRTGLVRCGSCKEIFNGIEHLLAPDGSPAQPAPAAKAPEPVEKTPATPASAPIHESSPKQESIGDASSAGIPISILISPPAPVPAPTSATLDFAYPEPMPEQEPEPVSEPEPTSISALEAETSSEIHASEAVEFVEFVEVPRQPKEPTFEAHDAGDGDAHPEDPLQRMTLVDFSDTLPPAESSASESESAAEPAPSPEEPDPLDQVIDELKRKPLRGKKKPKPYARRPTQEVEPEAELDIPEPEEPDFVKQSRHKQTVGRTIRIAMGIASFFLLLAGLAQATYTFRDQIAGRVPETKPFLLSVCTLLDCKIGLPAQIETISIESDQLETLNTNRDVSELGMLLRNVSTITQAWPHLELTLNDANNTMLSRRVFAPQEYLPASQDEKKGMVANSEQAIKLDFEFSGTKPAGYHVGVFYP
ncbi:MAG TPA: DUF3426 domain-containing protein [Burkholderiaceae bacterium]|jgi:predicted Zn finger-like uncharacterized protein|nr:DUF3426 domain-containing protein [Burkholderiaceae bacterium]